MPWIQFKCLTEQESVEAVSDFLEDQGALSVTYTDAEDLPILEPLPGQTPLWERVVVTGLFEADVDTDALLLNWKNSKIAQLARNEKVEVLEDKDWIRAWMDQFEPIDCGNHLWICPSWKPAPEPNAKNVLLDPGLAFGTGTHPTTFLCLQWIGSQDFTGKQVLDFGCGSGILAIAAAKCGAKTLYCWDIDPQALIATKENAQRNNVNDLILIENEQELEDKKVDILLANILAGPLKSLAPNIAERVKSGGDLVLSGLLESQVDELCEVYSQWFEITSVELKEEWGRIVCRKR